VKIYAPEGQLYKAVDAGLLLSYSEDRTGQILEEGITEAAPWRASRRPARLTRPGPRP